jgi:hypothetical protein
VRQSLASNALARRDTRSRRPGPRLIFVSYDWQVRCYQRAVMTAFLFLVRSDFDVDRLPYRLGDHGQRSVSGVRGREGLKGIRAPPPHTAWSSRDRFPSVSLSTSPRPVVAILDGDRRTPWLSNQCQPDDPYRAARTSLTWRPLATDAFCASLKREPQWGDAPGRRETGERKLV